MSHFKILICLVSIFSYDFVFACSSSDYDQVVTIKGMNLPFPFVYTTSSIDGISAATSSSEALKNIQEFGQNVINSLLRVTLTELGYTSYLIDSILSSLDVTVSSDYQPLSCANFIALFEASATTAAPVVNTNRKGTWCLYTTDNVVTKICPNQGNTSSTCVAETISLPSNVTTINFDFIPGFLAAQPTKFWKTLKSSLETQLKTGPYSSAFQSATVDFKKSST